MRATGDRTLTAASSACSSAEACPGKGLGEGAVGKPNQPGFPPPPPPPPFWVGCEARMPWHALGAMEHVSERFALIGRSAAM